MAKKSVYAWVSVSTSACQVRKEKLCDLYFFLIWSPYIILSPYIDEIELKKRKVSKKQDLNLPYTGNYLHTIYIVIGIMCYVEMI